MMLFSFLGVLGVSLFNAFVFAAAASHIPAMQWRTLQSGASFPYSRRICADSAPTPLLPAEICVAKFAMQRQSPVFPPFIAATIFAIVSILIHIATIYFHIFALRL